MGAISRSVEEDAHSNSLRALLKSILLKTRPLQDRFQPEINKKMVRTYNNLIDTAQS